MLAAGLDASASIHTFAFYPPGRLGDGAAVLEKASKTDSRLLSLIPGVSPHFATSKSHKDFGKDLLSLGLACSQPLLLSLLLPGIFNGRQQSIWCVQHTERWRRRRVRGSRLLPALLPGPQGCRDLQEGPCASVLVVAPCRAPILVTLTPCWFRLLL